MNGIARLEGECLRCIGEHSYFILIHLGEDAKLDKKWDEIVSLLKCNRVGLYVAIDRNKTFQVTRSDVDQTLRIVQGKGFVGYAHEQKRGYATTDVKKDKMASMYHEKFDLPTYDGLALVTHPILDYDEECLGVLEAVSASPFSERQRLMLHQLSQHCAIAIRNAAVYREAVMQHDRANGLLNVAKTLGQKNLSAFETLAGITSNASQLVQADRATLHVCDYQTRELWHFETASGREVRSPMGKGLVGKSCEEQKVMNFTDVYDDADFDKTADLRTGYRTRSMLLVPVMSQVGTQVLGILQLINKSEVDGSAGEFEKDEEELMQSFANYVSAEIESSGFLYRKSKEQQARRSDEEEA